MVKYPLKSLKGEEKSVDCSSTVCVTRRRAMRLARTAPLVERDGNVPREHTVVYTPRSRRGKTAGTATTTLNSCESMLEAVARAPLTDAMSDDVASVIFNLISLCLSMIYLWYDLSMSTRHTR